MPSALTMLAVSSRVTPMKPILTPPFFQMKYGSRIGLPVFSRVTFAARNREVGAAEAAAVVAAVLRVATAVLDAGELGRALVELVVADGGDVELQLVERLDRGLVVEQAGDQRGGADHVARRPR